MKINKIVVCAKGLENFVDGRFYSAKIIGDSVYVINNPNVDKFKTFSKSDFVGAIDYEDETVYTTVKKLNEYDNMIYYEGIETIMHNSEIFSEAAYVFIYDKSSQEYSYTYIAEGLLLAIMNKEQIHDSKIGNVNPDVEFIIY